MSKLFRQRKLFSSGGYSDYLFVLFVCFFNPLTAPAYKLSGLKATGTCLQTVCFEFPIVNAVRFDENPFPCQCENKDKKAKRFQISHFYWSFFSYIMAVEGLRKRAYLSWNRVPDSRCLELESCGTTCCLIWWWWFLFIAEEKRTFTPSKAGPQNCIVSLTSTVCRGECSLSLFFFFPAHLWCVEVVALQVVFTTSLAGLINSL